MDAQRQLAEMSNGLRFEVTAGGLSIHFLPDINNVALDIHELHREFAQYLEQGEIEQIDLNKILKQQHANETAFDLAITTRHDASAEIQVRNDQLEAWLIIIPASGGGAAITSQVVEQCIARHGITTGIDAEAISQLVNRAGSANEIIEACVARGQAAKDGLDTRLRSLIPSTRDRRPRVISNDCVDYRDLGEIISVTAAEEVIEVLPSTRGENGITVNGGVIPASHGRNIQFKLDHNTLRESANKDNVWESRISGLPVILADGAKIEHVMTTHNVDVSTGNIDFDGSLIIQGDIQAGMKVDVTGDITVQGMVEAAALNAGGAITIQGGIVGHNGSNPSASKTNGETANIVCQGTLSARFIENANVESGDTITVEQLISHSNVTSFNQINVGLQNARKGDIRGGTVRATSTIRAVNLGSPANIATTIESGFNHEIEKAAHALKDQLTDNEIRLRTLTQTLNRLIHQKPESTLTKGPILKRELNEVMNDRRALLIEYKALERDLLLAANAAIHVWAHTYNRVSLVLNGKSLNIHEDKTAGLFKLSGEQIHFITHDK